MKNTRALIVLAIALLAGIGAVLLAFRWLSNQSTSNVARVVVAAADINLGQRISADMVKLVDWPTGSVPEASFSEADQLDGRVARTGMQRGEPVLETKLAPKGSQGGLSAVIGEGRRAITVRVNDVIGVAGFALPGNFVDIIVNTHRDDKGNGNQQAISKIVLERILVLAVAQEVNRDDTKPRVVNAVTLEVTPEQAEAIDLARSVGTLSLVLRNQIDPADVTTAGVTKESLLQSKLQAVANAAPVADPTLPNGAPAKLVPRKGATGQSASVRRATAKSQPLDVAATSTTEAHECVGVLNGLRGSRECY